MPKVFHKPVNNTKHHQYKTETFPHVFKVEAMSPVDLPVVVHGHCAKEDLILRRARELGSHKTRPQKVQ